MPIPGTNIKYGNPSFKWEIFTRKLGLKPRNLPIVGPTRNRNGASDTGTTFPRMIGICSKQGVTAPTTNTAADAPTGVGDICLHIKVNNAGLAHIPVASIDVYRCSAYTNTTTFTWAQIL